MPDSFDPKTPVPTSVGTVELVLHVTAGSPNTYSASYQFDVLDQDGAVIDTRRGNLVPHLTAGQTTAAKSFMDAMLAKAQGVIA